MGEEDPAAQAPTEFEAALEYARDFDRRLAGEDPNTTYPDDAEHWAMVYRELLSFKEALIQTAVKQGPLVPAEGGSEVDNDLLILHAEAVRLRSRAAFWAQRRAELER